MAINLSQYQYGVETIIKHIRNVTELMNQCCIIIMNRSNTHDNSKFSEEESSLIFHKYELDNSIYGSDEYFSLLKEIDGAVKHHYQNNRHHPEFHDCDFTAMNLFDLMEMLCDWIASSKSNDIAEILDIQQKRYKFSDEIKSILHNTYVEINGDIIIQKQTIKETMTVYLDKFNFEQNNLVIGQEIIICDADDIYDRHPMLFTITEIKDNGDDRMAITGVV